MKKSSQSYFKKNEQLCWTCIHSVPSLNGTRGCSWSLAFVPVDGWTATPVQRNDRGRVIQTYSIQECPKYIREVRKNV